MTAPPRRGDHRRLIWHRGGHGPALAADGHRVALLARRTDRIDALADELGNGTLAIRADVTDRNSIVAAAARVQQELGGADILVNNAGVMLTAPFTSDQREEHRRMVETNLLGTMTTTEVFLAQLHANGGGDLVNVSSVVGRLAPAGFAAYAATKWGLNGWSEPSRVELQPHIRVIVIEPGAIATELSDHITHADSKRAAKEYLDRAIPLRTSPKSSPSRSAGRRASLSTRSSCARACRRCERRRDPATAKAFQPGSGTPVERSGGNRLGPMASPTPQQPRTERLTGTQQAQTASHGAELSGRRSRVRVPSLP